VSRTSLQAHLDLAALEGGVACFGSRSPTHAVAVLDVVGAEAALAGADEATQEELLAGRAQFLNAQTSPFQIVVRAEPTRLEGHLRRVQARVESLPEALRAIALDYLGYLPSLAQQRTLLERHCYVVLPDQRAEIPAVALSRRLQRLVARGRHGEPLADPEAVSAPVARRLQARADQVGGQLARSGLRTRRLDSRQIAELLHRCWSPELARVQRLRDELAAYTSLVVSCRKLAHHPMPLLADTAGGTKPAPPRESEEDEQLFMLGTRRLADLIAPSGCEARTDHLRLDGQYARVLVVTAYPRLVSPGWLSRLVETDLPIEASLFVRPLDCASMVRTLGAQIARLQSSRLATLRGERIADPEREIALDDAERLRERLQRGEERLFAVSLYLLVRAKFLSSTCSPGASRSTWTPCWRIHDRQCGSSSAAFRAACQKRATSSECRATWTPARLRPRCHSSARRWPWKTACWWASPAPARCQCCWTRSTGRWTTPTLPSSHPPAPGKASSASC
jgi:hypothetical protein